MEAKKFTFGNDPIANDTILQEVIQLIVELFIPEQINFEIKHSGTDDHKEYISMYLREVDSEYGLEFKITHPVAGLDIIVVDYDGECVIPRLTNKLYWITKDLSNFSLTELFPEISDKYRMVRKELT